MSKVPYNYQDIRSTLESYLKSDRDADAYNYAFTALTDIKDNAGHYMVSRRAFAARFALVVLHVHGEYGSNPYDRELVRRRAALGE